MDPNISMAEIDEAICDEIVKSFRGYNKNYAFGKVTMYFRFTVNPEGAI